MGPRRALGILLLAGAIVRAQEESEPAESAGDPFPTIPLPSDSILHPAWESQGLFLEVRHEFDRTVLRPTIAWQDSIAGTTLEVLDTSAMAIHPSPARMDADHGFHAAVSRSLKGGEAAFSWQQIAQVEGQFADASSLGGSHTRGRILAGWNRPWTDLGIRLGGWGGMLVERDDPASGSLSLVPGDPPHRGWFATSLGALEGGWSRSDEDRDAGLSAHVQRDLGQSRLREESGTLAGNWSGRGDVLGTLAAEASVDAVRRRSEVLGMDRDVVRRNLDGSWKLPVRDQNLSLSAGMGDTLSLDYTGRVPGQDAWGWNGTGAIGGSLPMGLFHLHDLSVAWADRRVLDIEGLQGTLERSQSSRDDLVRLADTLGWRTADWGKFQVQGGWARSLARSRHPRNPEQGVADRPDQDVSELGWGVAIRDSALQRDDKPLFSWAWLGRDEVYLKAVRSAETRRREGHRLAADLAFVPAERITIELGSNAREQRTTYRFDSTRDEGLMEWQGDVALQEGPSSRPHVRVSLENRLTWSGALQDGDFAVERRTVLWKPGAKLWWRPRADFSLAPGLERWIETSQTWDGIELAPDPRNAEWRASLEATAERGPGAVHLSLLRVMADPGTDDWRFSGDARWTW